MRYISALSLAFLFSYCASSLELKENLANKELYESKCQKCHDLHAPDEYEDDQKWSDILEIMSKKAKLTAEERNRIYTYLTTNN